VPICTGFADKELGGLIFIDTETHLPAYVIGNYAAHPLAGHSIGLGGRRISADFPGAFRDYITANTGAAAMFISGAAGDMVPKEDELGDDAGHLLGPLGRRDRVGEPQGHQSACGGVQIFDVPDGASLLAAIIVLAIMILPSIIKMSITALDAVPKEYEDASLALGATPIETYFKVSVPAAKSGIAASVVLGVGRAIGEAMAVMMVAGNVPNMPNSLFQSVRFLTTAVSSEMAYSSGLQQQALFSIALVLFLFIMLINAALNFFLKREKE